MSRSLRILSHVAKRWIGVRSYHELSYASHGEPTSVLKHIKLDASDEDPPSYLEDAVRVEMWHAPLNPADINTIQGKYPSPFPEDGIRTSRFASGMTVAGSEGWGRVTNVMGDTGGVELGDIVCVGRSGLGTFRSSLWTPASTVLRLRQGHQLKELLGSQAVVIPQLGGTALRMLHDFVTLQPGEVILQNAGNSSVGFMTSQLASTLLGVSVVSFARRGKRSNEQWEELVQHLITEGKCAKVIAEEDLTSRETIKDFHDELKSMSETGLLPSLALNAVGGESASLLCKCLEKGGTMVTFGGMSKLPVTIPTSQLIFRDLRLRGYWHSKWMVESALPTRQQLVDELADAVLRRSIVCPPVKEFSFSEVDEALTYDHYEHAIRRKVVFRCQER